MHPETVTKILIVRLSALGDIILTLPVLDVLRQQFPNAQIDWAVSEEGAALLDNHPLIHQLHILPKFRLQKISGVIKKLQKINAEHYDIVIDCQGLLKSAIPTALSGAKARIGFSSARELAWLTYNQRAKYRPLMNHQKPFHDSLFALTDLLRCSRPAQPTYPLAIDSDKAPPGNVIAIAPFTKWSSKDWPITHWQALVKQITDHTDAEIWLLGSAENLRTPEAESLLKINTRVKATSLALKELITRLKQAKIVIAGDSFPIHLAGAIGIPYIIGLYGATSSLRTHPPLWKSDFKPILAPQYPLECQPCHRKACHVLGHPCMSQILPEAVWSHIQPLINQDVTV